MKSNFKILLLLFSVLLFSISCSSEHTPRPTGNPDAIAIWGEITNAKEKTFAKVVIEQIPNLTYSSSTLKRLTPKDIRNIILLDKENNEIPLTYYQGVFKADSINKPTSPFTLKINIKDNNYSAQAEMPQKAEVSELKIKKIKNDREMDFLSFNLIINTLKAPVIIDLLAFDDNGKIFKLNLSNIKGDNLNNSYRELNKYPKMIFIEKQIISYQSFEIIAPIKESDKIILRIRTVSQPYFKFLYNLEVQKEGEEINHGINPIGNIKNAYGGFGAIQEEQITISHIGSNFVFE